MSQYPNTALDYSAAGSHYALQIRSVPNECFTVAGFRGSHHGLSSDFLFEIDLVANAELLPVTVIGNAASLIIHWGRNDIYLHGIVAEFYRNDTTQNEMSYRAVVRSPLYPLKQNINNRVFINQSTPQIVSDVLLTAGISADHFTLELSDDYPPHEFIVQYNESDYDFVSRLLARAGIFFTFTSDQKVTRILFCDDSTARPELPGVSFLDYHPQSGTARQEETVYQISPEARLLPAQVRVSDYNYQTPDTLLEVTKTSAQSYSYGEEARYGDHFHTLDEGEKIAELRLQALDASRETVVAETDCRGVRPGYLLTINRHPNPDLNGQYLVVSMSHQADQSAGLAFSGEAKGPTYRNRLTLIKATTPYRAKIPTAPQVLGLFSARVESKGTEYAYLDAQGRYHVRTDFDRGAAAPAQASHPVRMMQPYAGNEYGMHFPLHGGTEVAMTCVNGDLNRPLILGALPNANTTSVVTSDNRTQNIIRTASGNELCLDDRIDQEKIDLFTAEQKNILTLDASKDAHKIRLATIEGKMEISAAKTMLIESGDSQNVQVGKDHIVTVENAQQLMTRNKDISLQAATDIQFKAKQNIQFDAENEDLTMTAAQDLIVDVERNMSMEIRNKDLTVNVDSGQLSMKAAKDISILGNGGGPITIKQGSGTIQISTSGELTFKAPQVSIYGTSINLKGSSIGGN